MIKLLLLLWLAMAALMATGWIVQQKAGNGGWTDVFWTFSMGLTGAAGALAPIGGVAWPTPRQAIVALLFAGWALRLGTYILIRVRTRPEDARYAKLREAWGPKAPLMMFGFLQLQALAGVVLLASVVAAARIADTALTPRDFAGFAILVIAVLGEAIADAQLRRFGADRVHHGQVCDVGLWSWSRHPNYFFQWFGWLAYPTIALNVFSPNLWGWVTLTAPAYMYYLLRFVSGVPPLEAHMLASRGEAFRAYQARVSVFFLLPPRRTAPPSPSVRETP